MSAKLEEHEKDLQAALGRWRQHSRRIVGLLWMRYALQGLAVAGALLLLAVLLGVLWMNAARFALPAVALGRDIAIAGAWLAGLVGLVLCCRWLGPLRMARRVESLDRGCDGLLLTAAEVAGAAASSGVTARPSEALRQRLLLRAAAYLAGDNPWRRFERRRRWQALAALAAVPLLAAASLYFGPTWLTTGVALIVDRGADPVASNPYALAVAPGDVSVLEGSDQRILAQPAGFTAQAISLEVRTEDAPEWRRSDMLRLGESADFEAYLLGLERSAEYRAVADGVVSPVHRIEVVPRPRVARIEIEYHYPAHTGVPPRIVADGGDIEAVAGTRVTVRVHPDRTSGAARLTLGAAPPIELAAEGKVWTAAFKISTDDRYRVELAALEGGGPSPASPEYRIAALADGLPLVSVARPGRDAKVSSVEEVEIQIDASDDVGVRALELVMSVNGGAEQTVALAVDSIPAAVRSGVHTVYLEDMGMEPGDLVAYYARARDSDRTERAVQSDIYFLEVRPFERRYRRARSGGGGGGGGRGGGDAMLAAQQKALVIALFKVVRDRDALTAAAHGEHVDLLGGAQERIRERVDAIARRLAERSIVAQEPGYKRMAEELPHASAAMIRVEAMLAIADTARALPQARTALLHLQRADAAFREVQVAQASRGGGGGGRAQANDLANLFKLEMDSFKSQYAHVRRARPPERSPEIDETMRRLEELARRQERALREAQAMLADADGSGAGGERRELLEQAEKILRTLERLSRKRPDPRLAQGAQRMREAVEAMREAGNGAGSGARERQRAAIESLREAQRLLDQMGPARLADTVRAAADRAKALESEQAGIARAAQAATTGGDHPERTVEQVHEAKGRMLSEVQQLQGDVDAAARQASKAADAVAGELRAAQEALKRGGVTGEIERTARAVAQSGAAGLDPEREARIGKALGETRARLEAAVAQVEAGTGDPAEGARRLAEATRRLADLRDGRSPGPGQRQPATAGTEGAQAAAGESGSQSNTRQGEAGGAQGSGTRQPGAADGQARSGQGRGGQGEEGGRQAGSRPGDGQRSGQGAPVRGVAGGPGNQRAGIALGGQFGGGRFGGPESNTDVRGLREGLRGSVEELRGIMRKFTPGGAAAGEIETVIRGLEGLAEADGARLETSFPELVATLQGIERRVREQQAQPPALLATRAEGAVPVRYRTSVEDYFRQLGRGTGGSEP